MLLYNYFFAKYIHLHIYYYKLPSWFTPMLPQSYYKYLPIWCTHRIRAAVQGSSEPSFTLVNHLLQPIASSSVRGVALTSVFSICVQAFCFVALPELVWTQMWTQPKLLPTEFFMIQDHFQLASALVSILSQYIHHGLCLL